MKDSDEPKGSTLMTNDPLESRPTADGELREQIKQLSVYKAATNFHEQYRPDKSNLTRFQANWIEGVLNLIKQNSPQGGVSPSPKQSSLAGDSSIPDDDSLQSQPQQPDSELEQRQDSEGGL